MMVSANVLTIFNMKTSGCRETVMLLTDPLYPGSWASLAAMSGSARSRIFPQAAAIPRCARPQWNGTLSA